MYKNIELKALIDNYICLSDWLNDNVNSFGINSKLANKINICSEEIFVNIASYAYPEEAGAVRISFIKKDNEVILIFEDEGFEYNPLEKEDPDITLSFDKRPIGGLGIFMVKEMSKNIKYERKDDKNILTITFDIE